MIVELTYDVFLIEYNIYGYEVAVHVPSKGQQYIFLATQEIPDFSSQEAEYYAKDMIKRLKDGRDSFADIFPRFCDKYPGERLEIL